MRTTVVPAQITTVEDRIAGSLTFAQIVLLVIPLFISAAIYVIFPPKMHFGVTKLVFIGLQYLFFGGLAIRFRGKIVADWLIIYLRFLFRPRKYIFIKNDLTGRDSSMQMLSSSNVSKKPIKEKTKKTYETLAPSEETHINQLLENPSLSLSLKLAKKGGIDVSLKSNKD
ncbi:MAG: PrgI family protein [Candidatus Buchananbacteria bacterium]|nr:PrgI family protein [Candidatus Buchananbacteria bacterium]